MHLLESIPVHFLGPELWYVAALIERIVCTSVAAGDAFRVTSDPQRVTCPRCRVVMPPRRGRS